MKTAPVMAYSYLRFSDAKQKKGFSHERQWEGSQALALKQKWSLDTTLSMSVRDLGRSGFRNEQRGLQAFIKAIDDGDVVPGSVLIVEKLDRLSRQELDTARELMRSILKKGVRIATIQPERIFDADSLNNPWQVMEMIMHFAVAHEESEKKSDRTKDNWQRKRKAGGRVTGKHPAWIKWNGSAYELDKAKAGVVARIFQWAIEGLGARRITKKLNRLCIPNIALGYKVDANPPQIAEQEMTDKKPPDLAGASEISPKPEKPQKQDRQPQQGYDKFVLDKVFATPSTVFSVCTPRLANLHADSLYVFDTNALLAPYRLGAGQADEIAKVYRGLAQTDRLFVPARAVQEFARNRTNVLKEMYDSLYEWQSKLESVPSLEKTQCPMLEGRQPYQELIEASEALSAARKKYGKSLTAVMKDLTDWCWDDPVSVLYKELFVDSRIINHDKKPDEVLESLDFRRTHKLPPGYKDGAKDDEGIGDLLIWLSLLKLGKDRKSHVVFVCNEEKPDWVVRTQKTVITVRTELTYEFHATTGFHFGLASYSEFLGLVGANKETVKRARYMEEADTFAFLRVQQRVSSLLQSLSVIVKTFLLTDHRDYDDYELIFDPHLDDLISAFRTSKAQYEAVIHAPVGIEILNELEESLHEIERYNGYLRHERVRMKRSGEEYTARLKQACESFLMSYERWASWYLAGSPETRTWGLATP